MADCRGFTDYTFSLFSLRRLLLHPTLHWRTPHLAHQCVNTTNNVVLKLTKRLPILAPVMLTSSGSATDKLPVVVGNTSGNSQIPVYQDAISDVVLNTCPIAPKSPIVQYLKSPLTPNSFLNLPVNTLRRINRRHIRCSSHS